MKTILPLVALMAACAAPQKSLEEEASDVCVKYSEGELVEDAYKNMVSSGVITAYDPVENCFDYRADYAMEALEGPLKGYPISYLFEARQGNSNKCFANRLDTAFVIGTKSALRIWYHDPVQENFIIRLYTKVNTFSDSPFNAETFIAAQKSRFSCEIPGYMGNAEEKEKCVRASEVLLNALRLECTINQMRRL